MIRSLLASGAALLVAGVVGSVGQAADASSSGLPGRWSVVTQGGIERPVGEIGLTRGGPANRLHVVWARRTGGNAYDLLYTPIDSASGSLGRPETIVTSWAAIGGAAVIATASYVRAFFPGAKTTNFGERNFGLNEAVRHWDRPGWAPYADSIFSDQFAHGRTPAAVGGPDPDGLQAWDGRDGVGVHVGSSPGNPFRLGYGSSLCCRHDVNLARSSSETWMAWCQMNDAPNGIWAQRVDPATGSPIGSALRMPGSVDGSGRRICEAGVRVPIVAREAGGFWVAAKSAAENAVLVWRIGGATVARPVRGTSIRRVALSARRDGRLWIGWSTRSRPTALRFRRTNKAASEYGAVVRVAPPRGQVDTLSLDVSAPDFSGTPALVASNKTDVLAKFQSISGADLYHTQVLPGLTLTVTRGKTRTTFRVWDAGDPVKGATVAVGGRTLVTSAAGSASADLRPGRYTAKASRAGYVGASLRVRVR